MRSSAHESGKDMDNDIAERRITGGVGQCVASSPASEMAVVLIGGDALHANDQTAMTPKSKHILDVASSFADAVDVAIRTFAACIEMAAAKHKSVIVSVIQGNHDRDAYLCVNAIVTIRALKCSVRAVSFLLWSGAVSCWHHITATRQRLSAL